MAPAACACQAPRKTQPAHRLQPSLSPGGALWDPPSRPFSMNLRASYCRASSQPRAPLNLTSLIYAFSVILSTQRCVSAHDVPGTETADGQERDSPSSEESPVLCLLQGRVTNTCSGERACPGCLKEGQAHQACRGFPTFRKISPTLSSHFLLSIFISYIFNFQISFLVLIFLFSWGSLKCTQKSAGNVHLDKGRFKLPEQETWL